jgi:transitional endoplasmic reticulum ATPase
MTAFKEPVSSGEKLRRTVKEAPAGVAGRGIVRLDPEDLRKLELAAGDIVSLRGKRRTFARVLYLHESQRGAGVAVLDGILRRNAETQLGEAVEIAAAAPSSAIRVKIALEGLTLTEAARKKLPVALIDIPLAAGDAIRVPLTGGSSAAGEILATDPEGPVLIAGTTVIETVSKESPGATRGVTYEDLGGLAKEIARVREMIELPLRRPDLFERIGIDPPRGILFSGPPGTGKTLLARALAYENQCAYFQISGPEIVAKHYGESEAQLRSIFEQARAQAPAIVFIDELDAIAPKRDDLSGDRQVERRIVGQLLTLLDGVKGRGAVTVIAATNLPDSIDPALRRPGRFDREIKFGAPDQKGRREILEVHSKTMPLARGVDLDHVAAISHGYVGADLAALCRESAMAALRRVGATGSGADSVQPESLFVTSEDFEVGFAETRPSAMRQFVADIPNVPWSAVGGLDSIREALIEAVVWPLRYKERFSAMNLRPSKGVLLHGAPGTGKTLIAKALATEAGVNFISIRGPQLLSQFLGESERAVREIFTQARSMSPVVIFFDEIDALAPARSGADGGATDRVVAQLLTEIDGVEELKGVFLLAATNRVDRVDPALLRPGRFDNVIEMPLPDFSARREILAIHLAKLVLDPEVSLETLAFRSVDFTGAELAGLVQIAARTALRRAVASRSLFVATPLGVGDFDAAFESLRANGRRSTICEPHKVGAPQ